MKATERYIDIRTKPYPNPDGLYKLTIKRVGQRTRAHQVDDARANRIKQIVDGALAHWIVDFIGGEIVLFASLPREASR